MLAHRELHGLIHIHDVTKVARMSANNAPQPVKLSLPLV